MGVHFAVRSVRLRSRMDARANRNYLRKALLFLGFSLVGSSLLRAGAGSVPMPFTWTMLLLLTTVTVLMGCLKRA
jgi:uncharacterized membrane protein